jgi:SAM-dependent methyltransferase
VAFVLRPGQWPVSEGIECSATAVAKKNAYTTDSTVTHIEGSARSADIVIPLILTWLDPLSVLDVGCGTGTWLRACAGLGIDDYFGVDGYATEASLVIPRDRFQRADLRLPLDMGRRFDLVMSLEVAEHIDPGSADIFVDSLCRHSDAILFSAAIPGQGGIGHVNEAWPTYWVNKFALRDFDVFDLVRPRIWEDQRVQDWYRQNTLLFGKGKIARVLASVAPGESTMLDVVHPERFQTHTQHQPGGVRQALSDLGKALPRAVTRRLPRATVTRS